MTEYAHAIDVSHHQAPAAVPWRELAENGVRACWVRAAYGTTPDERAAEHIGLARAAGMAVGLYTFWRAMQDDAAQLAALRAQHAACGVGPGDLAPWLDVEDDRDRRGNVISPMARGWLPRVESCMRALVSEYGAACLYAYESALDGPLSWPEWPTVVAHYRGEREQRWPPCAVTAPPWADVVGHQYGVGPGVTHRGPQLSLDAGALDRDWMRWPPLRIGDAPALPGPAPVVPLTDQQIAAHAALAAQKGIQGIR